MEGPAMDWRTEECPSDEREMAWISSTGVSLGKKFLVAGVVVSSAPLLVPPLVVVSLIAMICSVPYCLFLASYACTQKLMNALLPSSAYDGGSEETVGFEKNEYGFEEPVMEENKSGYVDVDGEGITGMDETELVIDKDEPSSGVSENKETEKETKNLIENIRDEGRTDEVHGRTLEKAFQEDEKQIGSSDAKSQKVGARAEDLPERKEARESRNADEKGEADKHEGELESTVTETSTSTRKDEEMAPNEPVDRAVDAPRGNGEEKPKNSNKKKKKTGRSGGGGGVQ